MCGQCDEMFNNAFNSDAFVGEPALTADEEAQANAFLDKIKEFYEKASAQVGEEKAMEMLVGVSRLAGMDEPTIGLIVIGLKLGAL